MLSRYRSLSRATRRTGRLEIVFTSRAPHPYLSGPAPRAFAHRGWHVGDLAGMENSLSAFRRALQEGYRYIETDVHSTRDGVPAIHHDPNLDRTTDRSGPIATQPWAQVRQANIAGYEPLARLEDALEEFPDAAFNIDVKTAGAVEPVVHTIKRMRVFDRVAVASFSATRLARARRLAGPKLATALTPRATALLRFGGPVRLPLSLLDGMMAQVPVRFGRISLIDRRFLRAATRVGIEVHVWTINDAAHMHQLLDIGVSGVITDRPELLRQVLAERGQWHPHSHMDATSRTVTRSITESRS